MQAKHFLLWIAIITIFLFFPLHIFAFDDIWYYQPTPQGLVGISRPTISWVFDSVGENVITDIDVVIDGKSYKGHYNKASKKITFIPPTPLESGSHNTTIIVTINGNQQIKNSFKFEIDENPIDDLSSIQNVEAIKETINKYRKIIGINTVRYSNSLNMAAQAHSEYMLENGEGHFQYNTNSSLFTGEEPWNRVNYFNYNGPLVEEVLGHSPSPQQGVMNWMNSVYDRLKLINPKFTEIGYGFSSNEENSINVLDLGIYSFGEFDEKVITYPADGQRFLPISWENKGETNPLRYFNSTITTGGYPITLSVFGNDIKGILVDKAKLYKEDKEIKTYVLVPDNDDEIVTESYYKKADEDLITDTVLIPIEKLSKNSEYNVLVTGKILYNNGEKSTFSKEWRFFTGDGNFKFDYKDSIDELNIYLNSYEIFLSKNPLIEKGTTMIPIREFCEKIGISVTWREEDRGIILKNKERKITMRLDKDYATVNDKGTYMRRKAILVNGSSYAPLRFISEAFGLKVLWDGEYWDIYIQGELDN